MFDEKFHIFLIEDDPFYAKLLSHMIEAPDHQVQHFKTVKACKDFHKSTPNLISLDYSIPGKKGKDALEDIQKKFPDTPVIFTSGQEDVELAVELLKQGAYDYIVKNENTKAAIWKIIEQVKKNQLLQLKINNLTQQVTEKYQFSNLIKGNSDPIKKVFQLMKKACSSSIIVSIKGETGTGKELVAKAIHFNSKVKDEPFVAVNVAAIPSELIESELFGHEKGSFTGAHETRTGKFEEANGGTLFLDEIGEMDLNMQSKLLRVLQEKEVSKVGSNKVIPLNVRIIVATHKDLGEEVAKGNFREDFYYRILGLPIILPPLRERGNDILLLADFFIMEYCRNNEMLVKELSTEAKTKILSYKWPGNIRELKAVMELACVMSNEEIISAMDINFSAPGGLDKMLDEEMTLKEYNLKILEHYLEKYDNNINEVAKKLDLGKSTIYRMIKK